MAFHELATIFTDVGPAFRAGLKVLGVLWDGLKAIITPPIRFFIDVVLNDGVIRAFNDLAGALHTRKISPITLPPGFADGGVVTGPGGPRSDAIPILASAGEFIVNADATVRNRPLLHAINNGSNAAAQAIKHLTTIHTHLYLDGTQIAEVIDRRIAADHAAMGTFARGHPVAPAGHMQHDLDCATARFRRVGFKAGAENRVD